jgi:hypothetical protein
VVVGLFVVLQTVNLVENHFLTEGLVEGAVVVVGVDLQPEDCRLLVLLEALARVEQRRVREQQQQLYTNLVVRAIAGTAWQVRVPPWGQGPKHLTWPNLAQPLSKG